MNSENVKGNESYFSRNPESTAFVRILQQPQEFYRIRHESAPNHPLAELFWPKREQSTTLT